ncbi:MAG: hypothetical protein ACJATI_005609 [Halioglobus sp.]|jgi:hypothetical protein
MKQEHKIAIFLLIILLLTSCSKTVYTYSDSEGTSKFILYKTNYKYIENSKFGKFSATGTYESTDSLISFVYRDKDRIPYTYKSDNVQTLNRRKNYDYQIIHLTDKHSKSPILFASIAFKNKKGEIINGTDTDIDGIAIIKENKDIYKIEISYVGYGKQEFIYDKYIGYDLNIQLEELKPGGRMSGGCLIYYIDVILEYKIDNPSDITKLERNDIIYEKKEDTP